MIKKTPKFKDIKFEKSETYSFTSQERDRHVEEILEETKKGIQLNEMREIKSRDFASKVIINNV
ncbi:hypothetical protein [Phosphitispora fastidiosa]|uniref:hypothetical protein n=1 Tax=Phosphitispora fastidiosa TaxID=2837202 RepID=UPI001E2E6C31|nr:hypothetical protein [Phosphitispora fastidiosa]MBU7008214.1 hypothetical protein [Phosphitispora fastidiosa]